MKDLLHIRITEWNRPSSSLRANQFWISILVIFQTSTTDYVKTNFDGAIFKDLYAVGIGVVIWDKHGEVIIALVEKISLPKLVLTLETLEARLVVQFLQELDLHNSIFEGDSKTSINAISKGQLLHSSCGPWSYY